METTQTRTYAHSSQDRASCMLAPRGHGGFQDDQGKMAQVQTLCLRDRAPETTLAAADAAGRTSGQTCQPSCPFELEHVFHVCFCSVKPGDDGLLSTTDLTSSLPPAFPEKFQHFKEKRQATCGLIFELLSVPR